MDKGHIEIRVRAEGEDVLFTVEDNGVGMEPEQIEEFSAGSPTEVRHRHQECQRPAENLVRRRYGITIESVPDEGTKVTVRMPKVREEVEHEKH